MCKKLLSLMLVLVLAAVANAAVNATCGFNSNEDPPAYTLGDLGGQGDSINGWAGPWVTSHPTNPLDGVYDVVTPGHPDDPDQHLAMMGADSGSYRANRPLDSWASDFTISFALRVVVDEDPHRDMCRIELTDASGNAGMQISVGPSNFQMFQLNDTWMCVQTVDGAYPNNKNLEAEWVKIAVACDYDTQTWSMYWEQTDGSMLQLTNQPVGWDSSSFDGTFANMKIGSPKTYGDMDEGMLIDDIVITPEPATIMLLGLGGLALIRKKR